MDKKKVLIVDDDKNIAETLRFSLELEGYEVYEAYDGWQGLGAVRAIEPDLVILDVMLPKENGYLISARIKDDIKKGVYLHDIAIVLLTARDLSNDPEREKTVMEISRAECMMYKPFEIEKLLGKVKELLGAEVRAED